MGADEDVIDMAPEGADGSVSGRLRAAREALGMSVADVAAATRIPERHLRALEAGDFASLPARTYVVGFGRSYARVVGLDEESIVRDIADEYRGTAPQPDYASTPTFAPGDPARVPSRGVAWFGAAVAAVLAVAGFVYWQSGHGSGASLPSLLPEASAPAKPVAPKPVAPAVAASGAAPAAGAAPVAGAAAAPSGPVVLTAQMEGLWVRVSDADGKILYQKLMGKGESYTVPADAKQPKLRLGMANQIALTIGGKAVPMLSDKPVPMLDAPVWAEALLARAPVAAVPVAVVPVARVPVAVASAPAPAGPSAKPVVRMHAPRPAVAKPAASLAASPAAEPEPKPAAEAQ
jgi:cytoskeleton protein RodZ